MQLLKIFHPIVLVARQLLRLWETYTISDLKKAGNTLIKEFHPDNKAGGNRMKSVLTDIPIGIMIHLR